MMEPCGDRGCDALPSVTPNIAFKDGPLVPLDLPEVGENFFAS